MALIQISVLYDDEFRKGKTESHTIHKGNKLPQDLLNCVEMK